MYHHGDTGEDGQVLFHSVHGFLRKGATVDTTNLWTSAATYMEGFLTGGLLGKVNSAMSKKAT